MTFDAFEFSANAGRPVRLYEFRYGLTAWRYCSGDRDVTLGLEVYRAPKGGVRDKGAPQSGDSTTDLLTIVAPSDLPFLDLFRAMPPVDEVGVTVRTVHAGDTEARVEFVGSVSDVQARGADRVEIQCQDILVALDSSGLAIPWQRDCPYSVYDHNCQVTRELFRVMTTVAEISGVTISSPAFALFPDGWFAGGHVEWIATIGAVERRFVKAHAGVQLTLLGGASGLAADQAVSVFAGCDGTAQTCLDKFDKLDNYGGFLSIPGESLFDGRLPW